MQSELSVPDIILKRCLVFKNPVNALRLAERLLPIIADENLLLKHAAHVLDLFLFVYPIIDLTLGDKGLAMGRYDYKIGFDLAHHCLDERVEAVIDRHDYHQGCRSDSHTGGTYCRDYIDHVMRFLCNKIASGNVERKVHGLVID